MPNKNLSLRDQTAEFLLHTAPDSAIKVKVLRNNERIWLTQDRMAELLGLQRPVITKHLKNIFESGELQEEVVCSILERTTEYGAVAGHPISYLGHDSDPGIHHQGLCHG